MRFNDPNPGAFSFPAIITGFVFPKNSIIIGVIPRVRQYCADFVREWIYQKTHNSLAFLRSSHDIGNTSLKTYSFIDQAHPEDYSKYYTGFGLELDAQAFSFGTLSAQGIISNGTVRLINSREKPDSEFDTGVLFPGFHWLQHSISHLHLSVLRVHIIELVIIKRINLVFFRFG